jgi:histidine triad (HIT) family protein
MNKEKTIFEKIVSGEIPSNKVYEDEDIFAFLDIKPYSPGHTLVIPKKSYKDIFEIPEEILNKLFQAVKKISVAVKSSTEADAIKITMNNGKAAGQIVFHSHVHVVPKFDNKKFPEGYKYEEEEADSIAKKIQSEI